MVRFPPPPPKIVRYVLPPPLRIPKPKSTSNVTRTRISLVVVTSSLTLLGYTFVALGSAARVRVHA